QRSRGGGTAIDVVEIERDAQLVKVAGIFGEWPDHLIRRLGYPGRLDRDRLGERRRLIGRLADRNARGTEHADADEGRSAHERSPRYGHTRPSYSDQPLSRTAR